MVTGNNPPDPHFQTILRVLATRGADPEETRAVIDAYLHRPGNRQAELAPVDPQQGLRNTGNCAKTPPNVSMEKKKRRAKMDKHNTFGTFSQRGCLHQRGKNPVWYATISDDVLDENASVKRIRRKIRLGPVSELSEDDARRLMAETIARLNVKTTPTNLITVHQFVSQHFVPEVVKHMKYAGREHYRWVMDRHILPAIGDMKMRDVTLVHLQKLCSLKLESGLSVQTVTHIRSGLSAIFSRASALRIIEGVNPASAIRLPEMVRKERHTPTEEEARALLIVLENPAYSPCLEMVLLSCSTSIHYAEMAGLRWKRVNLTGSPVIADGKNLPPCAVAVRENYYRKEFGTPKTKARKRIEPLTPEIVQVLSAMKERTKFNGPEDLVFGKETGTAMDEDVMRRKLAKAAKAAGIPWGVTWHCFRRYFATASDRLGMATEDRKSSMGHASEEMTAHYTTTDIERRRPVMCQITTGLLKAPDTTLSTKPIPNEIDPAA